MEPNIQLPPGISEDQAFNIAYAVEELTYPSQAETVFFLAVSAVAENNNLTRRDVETCLAYRDEWVRLEQDPGEDGDDQGVF